MALVTPDDTYTHLPAFFACRSVARRWPEDALVEMLIRIVFDLRSTVGFPSDLLAESYTEVILFTVNLQVYLAHAAALACNVIRVFAPTFRLDNDNFVF